MTRTAASTLITRHARGPGLITAIVLGTGCATPRAVLRSFPEADVSTAEQLTRNWTASEMAVLFALAVAPEEPGDGTCPTRLDIGASTLWAGSCIDNTGHWWPPGGKLLRRRPDKLSAGYHHLVAADTGIAKGRVRMWKADEETRFSITLKLRDQDTDDLLVIDYRGRTTADLLSDTRDLAQPSVESGLGTVAVTSLGKVEVLHFDVVRDRSVCVSEPLSGITKLRAGGHTALITYDGEFDCDPAGLATWTLDGVPMGELDVGLWNCSTAPATRGGPGLLGPWLLVLMLVVRAARRSRELQVSVALQVVCSRDGLRHERLHSGMPWWPSRRPTVPPRPTAYGYECANCDARDRLRVMLHARVCGAPHRDPSHQMVYRTATLYLCEACNGIQLERYDHDCFAAPADEPWDMCFRYAIHPESWQVVRSLAEACASPTDERCTCASNEALRTDLPGGRKIEQRSY